MKKAMGRFLRENAKCAGEYGFDEEEVYGRKGEQEKVTQERQIQGRV